MPNITQNYSDCRLSAEIVEVCMFGYDSDRELLFITQSRTARCSVNLVVIPQTLDNKY